MGFLQDMGSQVSQTWNDVTSTGAPAIIAGVENYAAQVLSQQAQQNSTQAQQAINQVVGQPGPSQGIMASINKSFGDLGQNAALKQYGPLLIFGAIGFLAVGMFLKHK